MSTGVPQLCVFLIIYDVWVEVGVGVPINYLLGTSLPGISPPKLNTVGRLILAHLLLEFIPASELLTIGKHVGDDCYTVVLVILLLATSKLKIP